jgi:glycine/D-amino acid oxidase-like deaminating enzyme/nitrite reductase/ring-hydroxylating ferredoxin subunit
MKISTETVHQSYWITSTPKTNYPPLQHDLAADVLVVGGGLFGLTSAFLLQDAGLDVALVDRWAIGTRVSGHTTAKITAFHDLNYQDLVKSPGPEDARLYYESNQDAIAFAESLVKDHHIDCDFSRKDLYYFSRTERGAEIIDDEHKALDRLRIPCEVINHIDLPGSVTRALYMYEQAQFHPRKFMLGLAELFTRKGGHIFEESMATKVKPGTDIATGVNSHTVTSQHLVVASHYPFYEGGGMYNTKLKPRSAYGVALEVAEGYPDAMFVGADEHEHTFRSQPSVHGQVIIVGGEDHPMGGDSQYRFENMVSDVRDLFTVSRIDNVWSSHDLNTMDSMPYIGRLSGLHDNIFVATGFSEWGMSKSFIAAQIIADLVQGRDNELAKLYSESRLTRKTIPRAVEKIQDVAMYMVKPRLQRSGTSAGVGPNEGKILTIDKEKVAAYRDDKGHLEEVSSKCMHMGCIVGFNVSEQRWDCPCHGSQYLPDGTVTYGPTLYPLKKMREKEISEQS